MDINALFLRKKFWFYDFIFGSPIGKPYKEIEYISPVGGINLVHT